MTASSQYYSVTARVGVPHRHEVEVTIPLVGPAGPAGEGGGAATWDELSGKPATFPPSVHDHQPNEIYSDAVDLSDTTLSGGEANDIYLRDGDDNGKGLYKSPQGYAIFWDEAEEEWVLGNYTQSSKYFIGNAGGGDPTYPWQATEWVLGPQGSGEVPTVDQALLSNLQRNASQNNISTRTPKSGNASATELVLGSDTRLTNSRTPTAHASTHHTGGSDALTPANIGAAAASHSHALSAITDAGTAAAVDSDQDLGTTDDVTFRSVTAVGDPIEGYGGSFDKGLFSGNAIELSQYTTPDPADELPYLKFNGFMSGSVTLRPHSGSGVRNIGLPDASGTLALNETFASPPAIGSFAPAAASFTTLNATGTTELVNGGTTAGPFRVYNTSSASNTNFERGFMRWSSNVLQIGTEKAGTGTARALELQTDGVTRFTIAASGGITMPQGVTISNSGLATSGNGASLLFGRLLRFTVAQPIISSNTNILEVYNDLSVASGQTFRLYNNATSTTNFERLNLRWASNELIIDAEAGGTGTLRGIKLGSASTSLLGFFGATPVVRQAAIADATDAATTQARLNDLLATMRTFGLIAT